MPQLQLRKSWPYAKSAPYLLARALSGTEKKLDAISRFVNAAHPPSPKRTESCGNRISCGLDDLQFVHRAVGVPHGAFKLPHPQSRIL